MRIWIRQYWKIILPILAALLFFARAAQFSSKHGGVEFDSGWFLGVAKNLGKRGLYASYSNTMVEEERTFGRSIHSRYSVQDDKGNIFFPAGVTIGPAYIIPQALIYRFFGDGYWQNRGIALIGYFGLIYIISSILLRVGGPSAFALGVSWLWCIPTLTIGFSYESFGEHLALFYFLAGVSIFPFKENDNKRLLFSGLLLGCAIQTKLLFLILCLGFIPLIYFFDRKNMKLLSCFFIGMATPTFLFECYRFVDLYLRFGYAEYYASNVDFLRHFSSGGGALNIANITSRAIFQRMALFKNIGLVNVTFCFSILCIGTWHTYYKVRKNREIILLLAISFLGYLTWFVFLCKSGWARHGWPALILFIILTSIFIAVQLEKWKTWSPRLAVFFIVFSYMAWELNSSGKFNSSFHFHQSTVQNWNRDRTTGLANGLPSNPIFSLTEQKAVLEYFNKNVSKDDRVYTLGNHMVAEMAMLSDKVFFNFNRFYANKGFNPQGGRNLLIFGPYQKVKAGWRMVHARRYAEEVKMYCEKELFNNESYFLCETKKLD